MVNNKHAVLMVIMGMAVIIHLLGIDYAYAVTQIGQDYAVAVNSVSITMLNMWRNMVTD